MCQWIQDPIEDYYHVMYREDRNEYFNDFDTQFSLI